MEQRITLSDSVLHYSLSTLFILIYLILPITLGNCTNDTGGRLRQEVLLAQWQNN